MLDFSGSAANIKPDPRHMDSARQLISQGVPVTKKSQNAVLSLQDRFAHGRALRESVPRSAHEPWSPPKNRPDPIDLLQASDRGRLTQLLPIRYGRMMQSPFAFLRGAAAILAEDLANTPATGLHVQACGDCHLLNFGVFATPERALVFDINDFDETLPAPWEWDVKHLAISVVVAGRHRGLSAGKTLEAAIACVRAYREQLREYAGMPALSVWYARLDLEALLRLASNKAAKKRWQQEVSQARGHTGEHALRSLTESLDGRQRIADHPPYIYHPTKRESFERDLRSFFALYRRSLPDERRVLLDRYHLVDVAMKVVGVGSVGTRCAVALLEENGSEGSLLMQFKEARPSVLAPYTRRSAYVNQGQRVVAGQRLMQAASDILLGWSRVESKRHQIDFYFRQLRDMKASIDLDAMAPSDFADYAKLCGWALARAHARSGDAASIGGYAGKTDRLDRAIGAFAAAYADQVESDHARLLAAVRSGRIVADAQAD